MTIRKASLFAESTAIFSLLAGLDAKLLHASSQLYTL